MAGCPWLRRAKLGGELRYGHIYFVLLSEIKHRGMFSVGIIRLINNIIRLPNGIIRLINGIILIRPGQGLELGRD